MGLSTDSIFIYALSASEDIMQAVDGRLYGTAIPLPDEEADNVPVPYIIVTFNGLNNIDETKDDMYESDYDSVNIGIEVIGKTLGHLHDLTEMVRNVIHQYFVQNETPVEGYQFSAQATTEQRADNQQPEFVKDLIEKGTTTLSAPTREALAEMVGNLPAECKYMVGAVGRTQDGSTYTLQVDIIKN